MFEYRIEVKAQQAETISDELLLLGAEAITWLDASNQPIYEPLPGELLLWPKIIIVALITKTETKTEIHHYLSLRQQQHVIINFQCQEVPHEDWTSITLKQFNKTRFGNRLWIIPSHAQDHLISDHDVLLDPGLAFGTGSHPTTALCLEWLDKNVTQTLTIIDYGCGSGILAIAAIKLGAARAYATDYDPQALIACQNNASMNKVLDKIEIVEPNQFSQIETDVLIANIISNSLISLVTKFFALLKPGGRIVLSGILSEQTSDIITAFKPYFVMSPPISKEDWVLLEGRKV